MSRGTRGSLLTSRNSSRRGVLLLVILGMLTLFLMIGTAFIMSGNQYRRANKTYSKVGEAKNLQASQDGFLTEVINQIIRDTANQNSSLRFHSLLRDLYGMEGLVATILPNSAGFAGTTPNFLPAPYTPVGEVTGQQFIEFRFATTDVAPYFDLQGIPHSQSMPAPLNGTVQSLPVADSALNGSILTFLDGPAKGKSTRIVGYFNNPTNNIVSLRTLNVTSPDGIALLDPSVINGSRILINGRPFNGTGAGYNPDPTLAANDPKSGAKERVVFPSGTPEFEIALMPNAPFFNAANLVVNGTANYFHPQWTTLTPVQQQTLFNSLGFEGLGGSDESYDAPDFQNMFLAWTAPNPGETAIYDFNAPEHTVLTDPGIDREFGYNGNPDDDNGDGNPGDGNDGDDDRSLVIPSFHRPELIHYWAKHPTFFSTPGKVWEQSTLGEAYPMLRKVLLRPNWLDHPDFTGSNPELAACVNDRQRLARMIYGPWDVDNDMDRVRDSVWVDFGAPVMVGSKGRLVKPLAAIMVLDMDGRLNVNAHGTRELAGIGGGAVVPDPLINPVTGTTWNQVPRGQGFGVAEIDLGQLLNANTYERLMRGESRNIDNDADPDLFLAGRYGLTDLIKIDDEPGTKNAFELSAQLKMQGFPFQADSSPIVARSNFGTLPDLRSRYRTALNDFGQFVTTWTPADSNAHSLVEDNPYELDLSTTGARGDGTSVDNPFSVAELERLLRAYDLDAGTLSPRLFELLKGDQPNVPLNDLNIWRTLLTTDSYDLPEPGVQLPSWVRFGLNNAKEAAGNAQSDDFDNVMGRQPINATFADLVEYRLRISQNPPWHVSQDAANPTRLPIIQRQMRMLIAPEMMAGLKLDLNRPIGNGKDDDNNGVVDEPGEDEGPFWQFDDARLNPNEAANTAKDAFRSAAGAFQNAIDLDGDGTLSMTEQNFSNPTTHIGRVNLHNYRRQLLARHLYVLAYALVDPFQLNTSGTLPQASKIKARQLAQWAINAVDFRDPDNIMTAFEYDENPFDGWGVDGNAANTFGPDNTQGNADDDVANQRAVVWGLERPDLLITETLAWHDRRTTDTAREEIDPLYIGTRTEPGTLEDSDPKKRDPHLDSQYRPKGAAFIELYNPNAASGGASADTHAVQGFNINSNQPNVVPGQDLGVNLSAVAVDPDNNSRRSPVWRIQVVRNRKKDGLTYGPDLNPMLLFYDPEDRESLPAVNRPEVDRTIYFAPTDTVIQNLSPQYPVGYGFPDNSYQSLDSTDGVEFFTDLGIRPVRPGSYLVVGSGDETAPDSGIFRSPVGLTFVNNNPVQSGKIGRRIELRADVDLNNTAGASPAPVAVFNSATDASPRKTPAYNSHQYVADVAIINRVIDRTRDGTVQGPADRAFTFSEPANGYPTRLPNLGSLWSTTNIPSGGPEVEGWYVNGPNSSTPLPFDIPLDDNETAVRPLDPDLKNYGTVQGYRWIYLQRLANPLLPFNPERGEPGHDQNRPVNPYMTIDHSSVNLSVFNGMINSAIVQNSVNPESNFGASPAISGELSSVERGWRNDPADLAKTLYNAQNKTNVPTSHNNANPYNVETSGKRPRDNGRFPAGSGHFFNAMPDCSLGHLNQGFTQNYVGGDKVTPNQPFPWLTWNNRPFANAGELLFVPAMRSSQLLRAFSLLAAGNAAGTVDSNLKNEVFSGRVNTPINTYGNKYFPLFVKYLPIKDGPFGHLMNFFRTQSSNNTPTGDGIAGLHRVLDFVSVPSMYVGNETWLNPMAFGSTPVTSPLDPRYGLQPPFNKIASRREPGKVNINTLANGAVWHGLFHGSAKRDGTSSGHPVMDDDGFASVRRGYGTLGDGPTTLNANSPTLFANPFRPGSTGGFVPLPALLRNETESTFMRTTGQAPLNNSTPIPQSDPVGVPLFSADVTETTNATAYKHRDSNRNPYFRYSPISRLSSITTTRSNVFAIWVTVGFFEVEEVEPWSAVADKARYGNDPEVYNRVYPDGYRFGKEAGIETGEVERVREFAIVDRTIPVAFEPGANHNIGEMIRLRRKIKTE